MCLVSNRGCSGLTREIASEIFALGSLIRQDTEEKRLQKSRRYFLHEGSMIESLNMSGDQHRSIVQWLSPVDAEAIRTKLVSNRVSGSGTWFIDSEVFQTWVKSYESTILWLNGISQLLTLIIASNRWLMEHLQLEPVNQS